MSRSTANVSFYCRESKKNKDGLAPIEMVIILNTRRCFRAVIDENADIIIAQWNKHFNQ